MAVGLTIWVRRSVQDVYGFSLCFITLYHKNMFGSYYLHCCTVSNDIVILIYYVLVILWYFIIDHNMPPKKYAMNELDKKFDEKLSSFLN